MKTLAVVVVLTVVLVAEYLMLTWKNTTTCNKPFINYEDGCCLDQNNDGICDSSQNVSANVDSWQAAINSVDNLTMKYNLNCPNGIKENVLYVVHVMVTENKTECMKLKDRIDAIKSKPSIFDNYLKILDDCDSVTQEALIKNIRGFSYGKLLPLKSTIKNSNDFYYVYSGCLHEPDQEGGIFSFFEMAVDTGSGATAGMSSA